MAGRLEDVRELLRGGAPVNYADSVSEKRALQLTMPDFMQWLCDLGTPPLLMLCMGTKSSGAQEVCFPPRQSSWTPGCNGRWIKQPPFVLLEPANGIVTSHTLSVL